MEARTIVMMLALASCWSCSNDLFEDSTVLDNQGIANIPEAVNATGDDQGIVKDLKNYISLLRGGNKTTLRSAQGYTLDPFIYQGDTVMFVANYGNGWELLSTDHRVPLVIASSEEGQFSIEDIASTNPAALTYIYNIADELRFVKQTKDTEKRSYGQWKSLTLHEDEVNPDLIKVNPKKIAALSQAASLQPGSGHWELISTSSPKTTTSSIPHVIETRWSQRKPWNMYVPYVNGSSDEQCLAGCVAIAGAQYLYYLHYKNGKPATTVTTATYNKEDNTFNYTGSSSTVWDKMAKELSYSGHSQAAVLIGYVGKECNTKYGSEGSSSYLSELATFINQFKYSYKMTPIDYEYIQNQIEAKIPIIVSAVSPIIVDGKDSKVGHAFIIDRYKRTKTTVTSTFGWVGTDNLGNDSNDRDPEGNIVGYTFTYTKENIQSNIFQIGMNWGHGEYIYDKGWFDASSSADWEAYPGENYNLERYMLKQ